MRSKLLITFGAALIVALFFSGCSVEKRLARMVKNHPELLRDTVLIDYDTTIIDIPAVHTDSVVHINTFKSDTIIIEKEHLRIQTVYRNDSVFITGDCFGIKDTIVSMEEIHTKYIVNKEKESFFWLYMISIGIALILIYKELKSYGINRT